MTVSCSRAAYAGLLLRPVLQAYHKAQAGPGLINGAYFVVHQARSQADLPHDVLSQVGGDAGRALWPGDPEAARRPDRLGQLWEPLGQSVATRCEEQEHIARS